MSKSTPATQTLLRADIPFTLVNYEYDFKTERVGLQAAEALGVSASEVFKTLMAEIDHKPVCVIVPSDEHVNMKKLAAVFGGKSANMMRPSDAERLTGYKTGGISPLGQRKAVSTALDELAMLHDEIFVNGGQRGLQIRIRPLDLVNVLKCRMVDVVR